MASRTLLRTGVIGSIVAGLCCFTPALVILLGVFGLSAWLAWLDYILLPLLVVFLGIAAYAWATRPRARGPKEEAHR